MAFVEEPEIPTDDEVKTYLDLRLPITELVSGRIKSIGNDNVLSELRKEIVDKDLPLFEESMKKT
jgi:hypothetical protein